ncbi:MAG: leucine-rich repeat domain-containing protein, partial [Bacilli bacterium]
MTKKKTIFITIITFAIILLLSIGITAAYYAFNINGWGQQYSIIEMSLSVNGETDSNNSHTIDISTLDVSDGFRIDLDVTTTGSMTAAYATKYYISFNLPENDDISKYIEVYTIENSEYTFVSMLNEIDNYNIEGYLGANDYQNYNLMLAYSRSANPAYLATLGTSSFELTVSALSETINTDTSFPYYYVADSLLEQDDIDNGISVFKKLANNINTIKSRTLVLLEDTTLSANENIIFNGKVGIDLNGHTLDLNGGTIQITSTSTYNNVDVYIMDSAGGGSIINGGNTTPISINMANDIIKISDDLDTSITGLISIVAVSVTAIAAKVDSALSEYNGQILTTIGTKIDLTKDLKYYVTSGYCTVTLSDDSKTYIGNYNATEDGAYEITSVPEYDDTTCLSIVTTHAATSSSTRGNIIIRGTSSISIANDMFNKIPDIISGSLYLPTYDEASNSNLTWFTDNEDILDENGVFLPNGLSVLDSYKNQKIQLGLIVETNGTTYSFSEEFTAQILSATERLDLFYDYNQIALNTVGDAYTFSFENYLEINYNVTTEAEIEAILLATYGVNTVEEFSQKLGFESTEISALYIEDNFTTTDYYVKGYDSTSTPGTGVNTWVTDTNGSYSGQIEYYTENGVLSCKIELFNQPVIEYVGIDLSTDYTFLLNDFDSTEETINKIKSVIVIAPSAEGQLVDPTQELQQPLNEYESNSKNMANAYGLSIALATETTKETPVTYELGDDYDYLTLTGTTLSILPAYVPDHDTTVLIEATVEGVSEPYILTLTLPGLLHNYTDEIKDVNFYLALRSEFDINSDTWLSLAEAEAATVISLAYKKISSIKGIEYFENLTSIDLTGNSIVDLAQLTNFPNLTSLILAYNQITDISALSLLDNLERLDLRENQISDISPIQYLTNISILDVSSNAPILSFEPLRNYDNIDQLYIYNNSSYSTTEDTNFYMTMVYNNTSKANSTQDKLIYQTSGTANAAPSTEKAIAVEVMSNLVVPEETYSTLNLISSYVKDGTTYNLEYTSSDTDIISFDNTSYTYSINTPIVDQEVSIGISVSDGVTEYYLTRLINVNFLQSPDFSDICYIETSDGVFKLANKVVTDTTLLNKLFDIFNTTTTGVVDSTTYNEATTLSYDEIIVAQPVSLIDKGITSVEGLQYFTGINSLNLSGNVISDITPLKGITGLTSLTLGSKQYDFDDLVDASFTLQTLYITSCYNVDSDEVETQLYHFYNSNLTHTGNTQVLIYKDSTTEAWNPYTIPFAKFLQSLPSIYTFVNEGDSYSDLQTSYEFYPYDDTEPVNFDVSTSVGSYFFGNLKYRFSVSSDTTNITITYTSYATYPDVVYAEIAVTGGTVYKTIDGTQYLLSISSSKYIELVIDVIPNIVFDIGTTSYSLYELFPSNDISQAVMDAILPDLDTTYIKNTSDDMYHITQSDLANLQITNDKITIYGGMYTTGTILNGLHYLKDVTTLIVNYDMTIGDGSELINLDSLTINDAVVDMSKLDSTAISTAQTEVGNTVTGALGLTYLNISDSVGVVLYDNTYKDDTDVSNYTDSTIYYMNLLPDLASLYITLSDPDEGVQVHDFRFLKPYMVANNISTLDITGNYGAIFASTTDILTVMYNYFTTNNPTADITYTIPNTVTTSEELGYVFDTNDNPTTSVFVASGVTFTEEERAKAEYDEFAGSLIDYGLKISDSSYSAYADGYNAATYHYISTNQVVNNSGSIFLPATTSTYVGYDSAGNVISLTSPSGYDVTELKQFDISWRVVSDNADVLDYVLNTSGLSANVMVSGARISEYTLNDYNSTTDSYDYFGFGANTGVSNYDVDGNIKLQVTSLPYDYYIYIEGVIGEEYSSDVQYSVVYPILIKADKTAYTASVDGTYTVSLATGNMTIQYLSDNSAYQALSTVNKDWIQLEENAFIMTKDGVSGIYYQYSVFEDLNYRFQLYLFLNYSSMDDYLYSSAIPGCGALYYSSEINNIISTASSYYGAVAMREMYFSNSTAGGISGYFKCRYVSETMEAYNFNPSPSVTTGGVGLYKDISPLTLNGMEIFRNLVLFGAKSWDSAKYHFGALADISALGECFNLTTIYMEGTEVTDISALQPLTKLITVCISMSPIRHLYYQDTSGYYHNYLENSFSTLSSVDFSACANLNALDLYTFNGYYSYDDVTDTYTKQGGTGATVLTYLAFNLTDAVNKYASIQAFNAILTNTTFASTTSCTYSIFDNYNFNSFASATKTNLLSYYTDIFALKTELTSRGAFDSGILLSELPTSLTVNSHTYNLTLFNNLILTVDGSQYTAAYNGKFTIPVYFNIYSYLNVPFEIEVKTSALAGDIVYKADIYGTVYNAYDVFDYNLYNYFMANASLHSGVSFDDATHTLTITSSLTWLSINQSSYSVNITDLRGLEKLTNLRAIVVRYSRVTKLPDWTEDNLITSIYFDYPNAMTSTSYNMSLGIMDEEELAKIRFCPNLNRLYMRRYSSIDWNRPLTSAGTYDTLTDIVASFTSLATLRLDINNTFLDYTYDSSNSDLKTLNYEESLEKIQRVFGAPTENADGTITIQDQLLFGETGNSIDDITSLTYYSTTYQISGTGNRYNIWM